MSCCIANAISIHSYLDSRCAGQTCLHDAAAAESILDLGGANGNIYDIGYPHAFSDITVVDLPADKRCDMYRDLKMEARHVGGGQISILYSDMTDMHTIPGGSVDLIWMGQAIEHIRRKIASACMETLRVLRKGGYFCLDTPNRDITEIHTAGCGGGWIHPEHKIEYRPPHLRSNLLGAGFRIQQELGICEMLRTWNSKEFDYTDFVIGSAITSNLDRSYIIITNVSNPERDCARNGR